MSFARQSLWSILTLVFGIGVSVALPRLLGPAARGEYALAVKVAGLVLAFAQWGLPEVLVQYVAEQREHEQELLGTSLVLGIFGSALVGTLAALALPLLRDSLLRGVDLPVLAVALVGTLASIVGLLARRFIQLDRRIGVYNLLDVGRTLLFLLVAVALGLAFPRVAMGATVAWLLGELFLALAAVAYLRRAMNRGWLVHPRLAWTLVAAGLPLQLGIVAMFVGNEAGSFVLNAQLDLTAVGIYAVALSVAKMVLQVSTALRTVLLSRLVGPTVDAAEITVVVARHGLLWMVLVSLGLLLGIPLVPFVFGRAFAPTEPVLALALPGMVAYGMWQLVGGHLLRVGRRGTLGAVACGFAVASVLFQIVGVRAWGPPGAAAGLSAAYLLSAAAILVAFRAASGQPLSRLIPTAADLAVYSGLARQLVAARRGTQPRGAAG